MAYNAANRGNQKAMRESDAVIVPKIPGNAGEGKDAHTSRTCLRDTSAIRRDRRRDGNKTGQDKRNVRKQPEDGVHIVVPFN